MDAEIGDDGDLMLAHALGVHGLQTMPLLALAVAASTLSRPRRWVHVAGAAWLTVCTGALLQALFDEAPIEPSSLSVLTVVALLDVVADHGGGARLVDAVSEVADDLNRRSRGAGPVRRDDHPAGGRHGVHELQGRGGAAREQSAARAEHDRVDDEQVLVDESVLDQRGHQLAAAEHV